MNLSYDVTNPSRGAVIRFSVFPCGNYWVAGRQLPVELRLTPTAAVRRMFEILCARYLEGHRGSVTLSLQGKLIVLDPTVWQPLSECLIELFGALCEGLALDVDDIANG